MATFAERLKQLRREKGLSQDRLADILGVKRPTVTSWEAGRRTPELEKARLAADFFGVSVDYLLGTSDVRSRGGDGDSVPVPVYGEIKAGEPFPAEEEILDYEWVNYENLGPGEYFCLRVRGDSMIGANIPHGSTVVVRKQQVVRHGDIAVVWVRGEGATIKRIRFINGFVVLQPENPEHEPRFFKPEQLVILGRVVECRIRF